MFNRQQLWLCHNDPDKFKEVGIYTNEVHAQNYH
jgi:hypothetical protein